MGEETPYQWVQRRRSEGASTDELAQQLAAQGLGAVEIDRLLDRDVRPSARTDPAEDVGSGMASTKLLLALLFLVGGIVLLSGGWISLWSLALFLTGLTQTITAWSPERPSSQKQEEARLALLEPDETRARCAVHPLHAAMGTCARCGSFCCALCAPGRGFRRGSVCMRCQALPEVQALRQNRACRGAAVTLLMAPATIILLAAIARFVAAPSLDPRHMVFGLLVASAPWLLLAALQSSVRSGWPTAASLIPWLLVEAALVLQGAGRLGGTIWLFPLVVAFWGWLSVRRAALGEPAHLEARP